MKTIVTLVLSCLFFWSSAQDVGKKPNILFIFSDDHALQAITAYGSPHIKTPNIDRIAKEGVLFKNAFCTNSICAPSRAVLLTGKYNHLNGQPDNRTTTVMDTKQPSFPKYLQEQGYATSWIGKWHISNTPQYFDYWKILPGQGNYYNPDFINMDQTTERIEGYVSDIITDEALSWLDQNKDNSDKPFCMVIGHKAAHREWQPDIQDLHAFDGQPFQVPATFFDDYKGRKAAAHQLMEVKDMRWAMDLKVNAGQTEILKRMNADQLVGWNAYYDSENTKLDTLSMSPKDIAIWKYQRYMHDYMGCVLSLDRNIGRVLKYLDDHDLAKNTLVVYSSDQGFYLGEHGWFDKRFMYEPSLHMPLVMRYPGHIIPQTQINDMIVNIDYAPTLLDFAGIATPSDMQGHSFKSLLTGDKKSKAWRKSMYYHYTEYPDAHRVLPHFGIRTDRYKLICFYEEHTTNWELFDFKKDPDEMKNLIDAPKQKNRIAKLKTELHELMSQYNDTSALMVLHRR